MPYFKEPCIYKIICKNPEIKDCYVGSTTNFSMRKNTHKCKLNDLDFPVYRCIKENGGWDNWEMIKIECFENYEKQELHKKEREWIEKLDANLNKIIPTRTIKEHKHIYHKENRDYILKKMKERYLEQREDRLLKSKEKITCECGLIIRRDSLLRHMKTKKHAKLMAQLNEE